MELEHVHRVLPNAPRLSSSRLRMMGRDPSPSGEERSFVTSSPVCVQTHVALPWLSRLSVLDTESA